MCDLAAGLRRAVSLLGQMPDARIWYLIVSFVYALAFSIQFAVFSFHAKQAAVTDNGWDGLLYGVMLAAYPCFKSVSAPLFGYLSDQPLEPERWSHNPRATLLAATLLGSAFSWAATVLSDHPLWLLTCRVASGCFAANGALFQCLALDLGQTASNVPTTPPHGVQHQSSASSTASSILTQYSMCWAAAYLCAPPLIQLLRGRASACFLLSAVLCTLASAGVYFGLRRTSLLPSIVALPTTPKSDSKKPATSSVLGFAQSLLVSFQHPLLLTLFLTSLITPPTDLTFLLYPISSNSKPASQPVPPLNLLASLSAALADSPLPLTATDLGPTALSVTYALGAMCTLLFPLTPIAAAFSKHLSAPARACGGQFSAALFIAILPLCTSLHSLYVVVVLKGIAFVVLEPALTAFTSSLLPSPHAVGAYIGWQHAARGVSSTVSTVLGGWLCQRLGVSAPFMLNAIMLGSNAFLIACSRKQD